MATRRKPARKRAPALSAMEQTYKERKSAHGAFPEMARVTQVLKRALVDTPNWATLPDDMKEALEMNAHKTARILCGDPDHVDHWHDLVGYPGLVEKRLKGVKI
jgi:hypothetical protein